MWDIWAIIKQINLFLGKAMGVMVFIAVVVMIAAIAIPPQKRERDKGLCIFLVIGVILLLAVWFGTEPLLARIFLR